MIGAGEELFNYYRTNFNIVTNHRDNFFSPEELDNMLPWEREAYLQMLHNKLENDKATRTK